MLVKWGKEPWGAEEQPGKGVFLFSYFHPLGLWSRPLSLPVLIQFPLIAEEELED